ncbi:hypothetical protein FAZ19_03220 [Sphingobacterium alkalisoli]|uniref:Phosphatidate cytidylyltransferase n=1 Tax=Sphingobacterium alkalisoli TaxID=1874115 RepID=A0A4U0H8X8_9SPHI|nr:hypothetical protein [Sphingobacterium alkalisoli]TJY68281.1 hypothetical protein FAZ19_03220 [Sphingobacterium alkalisoli]
MKRHSIIPISILALITTLFTSCSVIEGIFKAGVWTGIIVVVLAVALIIWLIVKMTGGRNK